MPESRRSLAGPRFLVALAIGLGGLCCAAAPRPLADPASGPEPTELAGGVAVEHRLGPRATREDCFDGSAGARVAYAFQSSVPIRFDLHRHVGDETHYEVEPAPLTEVDHVLGLPAAGHYCLTYTNLGAGYAHVKGYYRVFSP